MYGSAHVLPSAKQSRITLITCSESCKTAISFCIGQEFSLLNIITTRSSSKKAVLVYSEYVLLELDSQRQ